MPPDEGATDRNDELEARRILGRYRRLVLLGRARLPLAEARRLVGPDCAFHLYFRHAPPPGRTRAPAALGVGGERRRPRSLRRHAR